MRWLRTILARGRWRRMQGAALLNEDSMAVYPMAVWGELRPGTWTVKRPLTVASSAAPIYLIFRVQR